MLEQLGTHALALRTRVDGQPRDSERRQRIRGEPLATRHGQTGDLELSSSDGDEATNRAILEGDGRGADVVAKLILTREAQEEAVEVDVPRTKVRTIVVGGQSSEFDGSPLLEERFQCLRRLAGLREAFDDSLTALASHHDSGRNDDVSRKLAERAEMVAERLLDEETLLQAMRLGVLIELSFGRGIDVS